MAVYGGLWIEAGTAYSGWRSGLGEEEEWDMSGLGTTDWFFRGMGGGQGVEAEFFRWFGGRSHEATEGIEYHAELAVVFLLHFIEFACEFSMGGEQLSEADKSTHDGDVHLHRAPAAQDAGKHGDTVLGEGHRDGPAEFAEARYHSL